MRAPIDDERVRRRVAEIRTIAFALVAAVVGAVVVHAFQQLLQTPIIARDGVEALPADPTRSWAAAITTSSLAWWAARGRETQRAIIRAAGAGALNGPLTILVFGVVEASRTGRGGELVVSLVGAACTSIATAPVGGAVGAGFGWALRSLRRGLDPIAERPTLTAMPRAMAIASLWSAAGFAAAAVAGSALVHARAIAGVLIAAAIIVAAIATFVARKRTSFAQDVGRGAVPGWRIELDEDGTRWLVGEERSGEGAYREGVASRRWARA